MSGSLPNYNALQSAYDVAKNSLDALQAEIDGIPAQVTQLEALRDAA